MDEGIDKDELKALQKDAGASALDNEAAKKTRGGSRTAALKAMELTKAELKRK